jgi:hypothetical protein
VLFLFNFIFVKLLLKYWGWYSEFGIATSYGLDGTGFKPRWGEFFRTHTGRSRGPPSLLYIGCGVPFHEVKRPGRGADHPLPSSPRLECGLNYTPVCPLSACLTCNGTATFNAYIFVRYDLKFRSSEQKHLLKPEYIS